jgi:aryl-alcohol dehydrogenase-like predicted oxidoreductase
MMRYRKFGNTGLTVSEIGFGAWAIGGGAMIGITSIGWGDVDDTVSKQAIHAALDVGVNFFDTADIYGLGHSEEMIGKAIGNNHSVMVATKVGNVAKDDQFTIDYSKAHILDACDESLKRLRRERIDYYQLHSARMSHLQAGECIDAMHQLLQDGKIRYWGLSLNTFDPMPEADYLVKNNLGNGFQLVLNILNQKALPLLQTAHSQGYGIVVRMPLQFGLLTGKFNVDSTFAINDHRRGRLTKQVILTSTEALEPVWKLCDKYNLTKSELALSYILSYPEVSTVIPGIRTPEHVSQNTINLRVLDTKDVKMIEALGEKEFVPVMELIQLQG